MTDITELAQRLKAAAEKATQGNWRAFQYHDGRCGIGGGHNAEIMVCEHISKERPHDAMFIALASPANILALVEALDKAQQEAEELSKFKEVMTSAANALKVGKPLNLESLFKGELASAMFAMMFAGEFVRSGATNYLELLYDVPEFGEMTVTLQKVEGKTPGQRIAELESRTVTVKQGEVLVTVAGFTGCGKSAIAGEIEIAMKAIGLPVTWANGDSEKRMTGADWLTAIEMYKPTVRIVEVNIHRAAGIKVEAE